MSHMKHLFEASRSPDQVKAAAERARIENEPAELRILTQRIEARILAEEGPFHVQGIYFGTPGDAELARHRVAERVAERALRARRVGGAYFVVSG